MDENFGLNEKQLAFCDYYLQCNNAGMAYKKAYDPLGEKDLKIGGCYTNGCRLLKKEKVQNYLTIKRSLIKSERLMETEEILAELNSLALDPSVKPSDRIRALELLGKSKAWYRTGSRSKKGSGKWFDWASRIIKVTFNECIM